MNSFTPTSAGSISRTLTIAFSAAILSLPGVFAFADETAPATTPAPSFEASSSSADISGGGSLGN